MEENKNCAANWRTPLAPIAENEYKELYEADIVIVGAGQSGTAAARSASENGASVIVLEQQKDESQRVLGGRIAAINSAFGRERGVPQYDPLVFMGEIMKRNQYRPNPELIREYAFHGGEAFDWFIEPLTDEQKEQITIFFNPVPKHAPETVNGFRWFCGSHVFPGGDGGSSKSADSPTMKYTVKKNQEVAKKLGAKYFFEHSAQQLLKEGDRVIGVAATNEAGDYIKFIAKKAVLLAAGDFSADPEMVKDLCPEIDRVNGGAEVRGMGWKGMGIRMGLWAGAKLDPGPIGAEGGNYCHIGSMFCGMFNVAMNEDGLRFCDECNGRVLAKRQPGDHLSFVWDSAWRERMEYQPIEHGVADPRSPETMELLNRIDEVVGTGREGFKVKSPHPPYLPLIYSADTYEELGDYMGFKGEALENFVNTMNRYNEMAYAGRDEDFAKDPAMLKPLDKPPFFGCNMPHMDPHMAVTKGGLWIDGKQRVLNENRRPIPGLFATGETAGQRYGVEYYPVMSGQSIGMCQAHGRAVGKYMAQL